MKAEQVLETYDASYASVYDDTFLQNNWVDESVAFQLGLLEKCLGSARNWLDVACGTGFVLGRFPHVERAGLDLSAAMLALAKERNPGATFVQRNYREPFPEWTDRWDVVSCMWWAYCMAETMAEIEQLIANLADWTSPGGTCFLPICNPQKFDRHNLRIPYIDARVRGRCVNTALMWTWIEENGKRHDDLISPQVDHLVAMFERHFEAVEVVEGPIEVIGEGRRTQDVLLARKKWAKRPARELYRPAEGVPLGLREWSFCTSPGTLAGLSFISRDLARVRIAIDERGSDQASSVQAQKVGYLLTRGQRYRLSFVARAASPRLLAVGVSDEASPSGSLGLYREIAVDGDWKQFEFVFESSGNSDRARVHFDLGQSGISIDLGDVRIDRIPG